MSMFASHRAGRLTWSALVGLALAGMMCLVVGTVPAWAASDDDARTDRPVLGPLSMGLSMSYEPQGAVSSVLTSFTLTARVATTFTSVRTVVRPASDPASTDGRLDVEASGPVTFSGTRTFSATADALAPGHYIARPAYQLDGRWVDGDVVVSFTVPGNPAPAPTPTTAPAPAPAPVAGPVVGPGPTPANVGSASGFSPGGAFPYLSEAALARDLDGIKASGATWVRVDFPWTTTEPSRGSYSWGNLDRVTAAAAARGIRVLALPAYSPAWARPAGCGTDKCPPADPADFARFVAAAAQRYGPDRVQAWELWNEPNIPSFWAPRPDTDAYAALLKVSAAALRAARPEAYILSAGLSPAYTDGTSVAPVDVVKRLYALGAMRDVDAVGIHPYSDRTLPLAPGTESWNTFLQMKTVHDVMTAHGDGAKQVWGTEFGVATGTSSKSTSEAQQAAIITQGYQRLADGSWPWLGTLFAYSLRDSADDVGDWQSNFGLQRSDGSPKPAYGAFSDVMRLPLVR